MATTTTTTTVKDMSGRDLEKGDTVSTLTGQMTGKICNLADEEDAAFICIRPPHQPYGNGVWHAADRCVLVTPARSPQEKAADAAGENGDGAGGANGNRKNNATAKGTRSAAKQPKSGASSNEAKTSNAADPNTKSTRDRASSAKRGSTVGPRSRKTPAKKK